MIRADYNFDLSVIRVHLLKMDYFRVLEKNFLRVNKL